MTEHVQRIRIQNFLANLGKAGEFYVVSYNASTGLAEDILRGESEKIEPTSSLANEVSASFDQDSNYGLTLKRKRNEWGFELKLAFSREALLDFFEESLLNPPIIPAEEGLAQVRLDLSSMIVNHPPQQSPSNGTTATLHFAAQVGRA